MEETSVQRLARVLRALVLIAFVCNLLVMPLVPGLAIRAVGAGTDQVFLVFRAMFGLAGVSALESVWQFLTDALWGVWTDRLLSLVTLFLWLCGICTAVILWQARRVLDTVLTGDTFTFGNAANMKRAAICCFLISAAALGRTVWGLCFYRSLMPLLTYNALFVPVFLMAGLLCMVMSALCRQAAELKAENDLTI